MKSVAKVLKGTLFLFLAVTFMSVSLVSCDDDDDDDSGSSGGGIK